MGLTVKPNVDGTITIKCGGNSVTIPAPATGLQPIWSPGSGASTSIIANGKAKTKVVQIPNANDLVEAIKREHKCHSGECEPTVFQFEIGGTEPVDIEAIDKTLSNLSGSQWMGIQFKLTGNRNE
ncbi:hypothetical protein GOL88_28820 [Sinorhizobium medicae]|nr:hypothetical protein [Sinorhizobium medicae]